MATSKKRLARIPFAALIGLSVDLRAIALTKRRFCAGVKTES